MIKSDWASLCDDLGNPMHLLGVRMQGELRGTLFEATVEQRFTNPGNEHVELIYTFPLPYGAVLLDMDVHLGNQQLRAHVAEKAQAEQQYENALVEGDAAIMLERAADGSYSLSLGNLAPQENCTITLRYAQILNFDQNSLRLMLPCTLAPRYGDPVQDAGLLPQQVPQQSLNLQYPLSVQLRLYGHLSHACVSSPSHALRFEMRHEDDQDILQLTLAQQAWLDRDVVLVLDEVLKKEEVELVEDLEEDEVDSESCDGLAVYGPDPVHPGSYATLISMQPDCSPGYGGNSAWGGSTAVKFLVDCSGSMAGGSIEAAKRALFAIIEQLRPWDSFSLSRFGTQSEHRSRSLWSARPNAKLAAQRWIQGLEADLGGTEMAEALVSTMAVHGGDCILLITDGDIHQIEETIRRAQKTGHRIFVVGIGSSPNEVFLRRLAEATRGACEFVAPGEAVEPAMLRMFKRLRSHFHDDLRVSWSPDCQPPMWQAPLPAGAYPDDTVHIMARLTQLDGNFAILCDQDPFSIVCDAPRLFGSVNLTQASFHAGDCLARILAAKQIQTLEQRIRIERQANDDPHCSQLIEQVTALALQYRLISSYTNFVLLHERAENEKAKDMPIVKPVPHMLAAGWAGIGMFGVSAFLRKSNAGMMFEMPAFLDSFPSMQAKGKLPSDAASNQACLSKLRDVAKWRTPTASALKERDGNGYLTPWGLSLYLQAMAEEQRPSNLEQVLQLPLASSVLGDLEDALMAYMDQSDNDDVQPVLAALWQLLIGPALHNWLAQGHPGSNHLAWSIALQTRMDAHGNHQPQDIQAWEAALQASPEEISPQLVLYWVTLLADIQAEVWGDFRHAPDLI